MKTSSLASSVLLAVGTVVASPAVASADGPPGLYVCHHRPSSP